MAIALVDTYVNELIDRSTLEEPVWNIEKIRAGKKASWDYIDGCMIMAFLVYVNDYNWKDKCTLIFLLNLLFSLSLAGYVLFFIGLFISYFIGAQ